MKPAKEYSRNNNIEKAGSGNQDSSGSASGGSSNTGSKKDGKRDSRGNRRWRKNRYRDNNRDKNRGRDRSEERNRESESREQKKDRVVYKCAICGKDIKDISSAIASADTQNPVHFDCMLEKLKSENKLENSERIVYLGGGSFGIVKQEKNRPAKEFSIVRKIEVENRDEKPEWRTGLIKAK